MRRKAPPVDGPFDVIVLSGSVAEVPPPLLGQLKPGGRLVAIVGQLPVMRAELVTRAPAPAAESSVRGRRLGRLFDRRPVRHRRAAADRLRRAEPVHLLGPAGDAAACFALRPGAPGAVCRPQRSSRRPRHAGRRISGRRDPESAYNLAGVAGQVPARAAASEKNPPGNPHADPASSTLGPLAVALAVSLAALAPSLSLGADR